MSIPNEFFTELDQRENDERESDIAAGFSEALKTGGEVTTPGGRTIRVVDAYDSRGGARSNSTAAAFLAGKYLVESYLQVDEALARALWTEEPNPAVVRLLTDLEPVDPPTLVSVTEIAQRLRVKPKTVHTWRERHEDFPPPLTVLAIGPVWEWVEVLAWALRTGRR